MLFCFEGKPLVERVGMVAGVYSCGDGSWSHWAEQLWSRTELPLRDVKVRVIHGTSSFDRAMGPKATHHLPGPGGRVDRPPAQPGKDAQVATGQRAGQAGDLVIVQDIGPGHGLFGRRGWRPGWGNPSGGDRGEIPGGAPARVLSVACHRSTRRLSTDAHGPGLSRRRSTRGRSTTAARLPRQGRGGPGHAAASRPRPSPLRSIRRRVRARTTRVSGRGSSRP